MSNTTEYLTSTTGIRFQVGVDNSGSLYTYDYDGTFHSWFNPISPDGSIWSFKLSGDGTIITTKTDNDSVEWDLIANKPTSLVGYNILDATPLSHVGSGNSAHAKATTTADGFMPASDKTKLNGIENNANNYIHPTYHLPSMISQDSNNRFVTDAQITSWNNAKSDAIAYATANAQITKITDDAGGAQINAVNTSDDILAMLLAKGKGLRAFYSVSGAVNNPMTGASIRGMAHFTSSNSGWLYATDTTNNVYTNFCDLGVWKGWNKFTTDKTPTWNSIALDNNVQSWGTTSTPQYSKVGNQVFIRGAVKNITGGVVIGTLPVGYRPSQSHSYTQTMSISGSNARFARWRVETDGTINLEYISDNSYSATNWHAISTNFLV